MCLWKASRSLHLFTVSQSMINWDPVLASIPGKHGKRVGKETPRVILWCLNSLIPSPWSTRYILSRVLQQYTLSMIHESAWISNKGTTRESGKNTGGDRDMEILKVNTGIRVQQQLLKFIREHWANIKQHLNLLISPPHTNQWYIIKNSVENKCWSW